MSDVVKADVLAEKDSLTRLKRWNANEEEGRLEDAIR
jgi:hypothetical protein